MLHFFFAPRPQTVDISLISTIFPVLGWGGVLLVCLGWMWSQIWPYFRDTHLPARNKALQDQAQAMKDIANLVSTVANEVTESRRDIANSRQETASAIAALQRDVNQIRLDIAILTERKEREHGAGD